MKPVDTVMLLACAAFVVIALGGWIVNGDLDLEILVGAALLALMTLLFARLQARRRNVES